jgi:hypothetical protein
MGIIRPHLNLLLVPLGFHRHRMFPVRYGQQTTIVSYTGVSGGLLTHIASSAKWKYKAVAIILAILMVYLLFAAVECAIQAADQGGTAYQIMWFSIVVTYGGETQHSNSGCRSSSLTSDLRSLHCG